jgi:sugar lactone lactonase YvrE
MGSRYAKALVGTAGAVVLVATASLTAGAANGGTANGGATVGTVAGTGSAGEAGDGGPSGRAQLTAPSGIAVDADGDVAVADSGNCRVELIAARSRRYLGVAMRAGHIYTVAGTGCGRRHSSAALSVGFPTGVAFDAAGDLLITDASGNRSLELPARSGLDHGVVQKAGRLTTVAGTGVAGSTTNGRAARSARLDDPEGIAVAATGDLYIADTAACRVEEVPAHDETRLGESLAAGHLYTVAGTGVCGYGGDGGPAVAAQLWSPSAVTVDGNGDLLIADEGNSAVREVPATSGTFYGVAIAAGAIGTVAGQDTYSVYLNDGLSATGPASDLNYPTGLAVEASGNLVIADSYDRCIVEVAGHSGVLEGRTEAPDDMYTVAGILPVGGPAFGDGTRWILTRVTYPYGVAFGPGGTLYFSDRGANTVRRITDL